MWNSKRNFVLTLLGLGLAVGAIACDPADDSGGDMDSGAEGTGGPSDGDGQFVRCCYFVTNSGNDGREACVPENNAFHACVDPADSLIDPNGSGTVDPAEVASFCSKKVPDNISVLNPWEFPFLTPGGDQLLDINGPWVSASAFGGALFGSCVPDLDPTADYPGSVVAPSHSGSFTSAAPQSSSVDLQLGGVQRVVSADGEFEISISDCELGRHQEICDLELRALNLDLDGPTAFSEYSLDTAVLSLQHVGKAPVTFDCSSGTSCVGSFDFSTRTGTSLDVLLQWDQTNLVTGSLGGGSLLLGENGLGSMGRVLGELQLDSSKEHGTLRLRGGGSDGFGGSFASIDFDVAGPISPYKVR